MTDQSITILKNELLAYITTRDFSFEIDRIGIMGYLSQIDLIKGWPGLTNF